MTTKHPPVTGYTIGQTVTRTTRRGGKHPSQTVWQGTVTELLTTRVRVRWTEKNGQKVSAHVSDHLPAELDTTGPQRIRLSRKKGARKPVDAITVSRGTRWGNPFRVGDEVVFTEPGDEASIAVVTVANRADAVTLYLAWLAGDIITSQTPPDDFTALAGHSLACWCPAVDPDGAPIPCHADVLLRLSNTPKQPSKETPMSKNLNPECVEGKHANCWGDALDPTTDDLGPCDCECHSDEQPPRCKCGRDWHAANGIDLNDDAWNARSPKRPDDSRTCPFYAFELHQDTHQVQDGAA
jgi:hypothetical protein